jgi:hypothetical protein
LRRSIRIRLIAVYELRNDYTITVKATQAGDGTQVYGVLGQQVAGPLADFFISRWNLSQKAWTPS